MQEIPDSKVAIDRESVELALTDIWRELLGTNELDPEIDFVAIGGDSHFAVGLIARIWDEFSIEISPGTLYDNATIKALSSYLVSSK